jgi:uncharacterized protein
VTLDGTFTFAGPRETVWELLHDPEVLVKAMPGARELKRTGEDQFEGVMKVSIGPMNAAEFRLSVQLSDQQAPERFTMQIDSRGTLGFARGTAHLTLDAPERDVTVLGYRSDLQIGGRIAAVGQRLLESAGRMMTRQGLDALQRELTARLSGGAAS